MNSRFHATLRAATLRCLACAALAVSAPGRAAEVSGIRAPHGFEVFLYADDDLATNVCALTVDAQGRVVVAGPGYVRILFDEDGDGKAERFQQFSDVPKTGAQGLFFEGRDLICTGDAGLLRLPDQNGDDRADGPPEVLLKIKAGGEHHVHAVQKGPDGWWYVIAGNDAGVNAGYVTLPTSPITKPRAGVLLRLKPDFSGSEVLCHGLRNAYDFDFSESGDIFTYDSDDERSVSLPWYRPTRVFQLTPGSDAGWVTRNWKHPNYYLEMPPVLAELGRGSPTGVVCYRHTQFPEPYRGAMFVLDWTFGRVIALPLEPSGSIWRSTPIEFLRGTGGFGFAPTDAAVGPDGSLYVSVGGRGTRGGVYRVKYTGPGGTEEGEKTSNIQHPTSNVEVKNDDRLKKVLRLQQALEACGREEGALPVFDGYAVGGVSDELRAASLAGLKSLQAAFPSGSASLDREVSRLAAMLKVNDRELLSRVIGTIGSESHPTEDIHYLIVAARLPAERTEDQTRHVAAALLNIDDKIERLDLHIDNDWEPRIGELVQELARRDARLLSQIVRHEDFGRSPGDLLFVEAAPRELQRRAADVIARHIADSPDYRWSPQLVFFFGRFNDDDLLPLIREQHQEFVLRSAVLQVLAKRPQAADREKFVAGLESSSHETLTACLNAIARLPASRAAGEQLALVKLLRSLGHDEAEQPLREKAINLLNRNLVQDFGFASGKEGRQPQTAVVQRWTDHIQRLYPVEAAAALESSTEDAAALKQLLDSVDWSAGDAARGKELFVKRSCANCHGGSRALGPDLAGVGKRFSRHDLFTAIALPHRDVPPRYQTTYIQTKDGRQLTGLVIYEAADGLILRDADNRTHRIDGDQIELKAVVPKSLMPGGLLKDLAPRDLADLAAYLQSL